MINFTNNSLHCFGGNRCNAYRTIISICEFIAFLVLVKIWKRVDVLVIPRGFLNSLYCDYIKILIVAARHRNFEFYKIIKYI